MHKLLFYPRMAFHNLLKNRQTYFPYLLTCLGTYMASYIYMTIAYNKGLEQMRGADNMKTIMELGVVIIGIFAAVFLFYTNSFLIKRRKKELGLYCILGMEKRHVGLILLFEVLLTFLVCVILGTLGGYVFGRLLFLLLLRIVNFQVPLKFYFSARAFFSTTLFFSAIFAENLLNNILQGRLANPVDLLLGSSRGEREPRASWILAVAGAAALALGYTISVTTQSPLEALTVFFCAVLLVIFGTYALFTSGSIVLLKTLRKKKDFYYRPQNFISVSGMIYRMKQNAVGLANICILSTMVLVVLSATISLYMGQKGTINTRYPNDLAVTARERELNADAVSRILEEEAEQFGIGITGSFSYHYANVMTLRNGSGISVLPDVDNANMRNNLFILNLLPLEEYNALAGTQAVLADDEALGFPIKGSLGTDALLVGDLSLKYRELDSFPLAEKRDYIYQEECWLVVNENTAQRIADQLNTDYLPLVLWSQRQCMDLTGDAKDCYEFSLAAKDRLYQEAEVSLVESRQTAEADFYILNGGFLFLGIFMGMLFMMAAALIIYFKQMSEGYDDHQRFEIMQKVGMDDREIRKTISKQILMVFFLPLLTAVLHMCFAFPVVSKLLMMFGLFDRRLFFLCTMAAAGVFGVFYVLIYHRTAKVYYRLVK